MAKFVIAYNRPQRRIELEDTYSGSDWEIALLASRSEESLRATHSRYFAHGVPAA
jgi:hypothetical protein